ncbi:MAG: hypothetical protein AB8B49_02340 [Nitratireductor sp.]
MSKTIWGSLISVLAALVASLGISIDGATQSVIADSVVQMVSAFGALFAIYGRLSATDIIS